MRNIKYHSEREDQVEKEIDNLFTIGKWIRSCETLEQLNTIDDFLSNYCKRTGKWYHSELSALNYHLGIIDGFYMSMVDKLKPKDEKTTLEMDS